MIVNFVASTAFLFYIFIPKIVILFDTELAIEKEREYIYTEIYYFAGRDEVEIETTNFRKTTF